MMQEAWFRDFGLSRESLAAGHWWTFLTYSLLHGAWWHAIGNLLGLWVLGRHVLDEYGVGVFFGLFWTGVVAGGLAQIAFGDDGILIGLSGGLMALCAAAGFLWGDRRVSIGLGPWRFGVVRGRYLGWGVLLASLGCALLGHWLPSGAMDIGHWCHAGAAVAGVLAIGLAWLAAPEVRV